VKGPIGWMESQGRANRPTGAGPHIPAVRSARDGAGRSTRLKRRSRALRTLAVTWVFGVTACGGVGEPPTGTEVDVHIPPGATTRTIGMELERAGLIAYPRAFALYARIRRAQRELKAGHYRFRVGQSWGELLAAMRTGDLVTVPLTIPEGFTLREIAPRIAELSGVPADSILDRLEDPGFAERMGIPGPTLEGYLFPETYRFSEGLDVEAIVRELVTRYRSFWGSHERALADSLELSEREVVTLASIVEEEARRGEERPRIAGVYLNRLRIGMLLQADPTVQYALGEPKPRLLFRDIEGVADHPYNTYTQPGLPPGPIASPGEASLRAVLEPEEHDFLFFVARSDGTHVFSRTSREHVNAINRIRRGEGR
jgi:UPF0755 protein